MKLLPAITAALSVCTAFCATYAQADPSQPIIQLPPRPGMAPSNSDVPAAQELDPDLTRKLAPAPGACLKDGTGYVRARIRGALNVDVTWKDPQLACGGEARPDGSGLRMSFAGPGPGGRVMRLVFGVRSAREGSSGHELPTNLTVLLDGGRVFSTQGDDKCTMDQLAQHELPNRGRVRAWRVEARGFCVEPANAVTGGGRVVVSRFDFAGRVEFFGRRQAAAR